MKLLFDFFPIALFFIAFKMGDIYLATITAIVASIVQVLWSRYKTGRFEKLPLITLGTIVILGGATLFFRNELFIKWKPTALYWVLALALLISQFIGKKPLMQRLLEQNVDLPIKIWHQLNLSWALFFAAMGVANLYVVYHFDTNTWVNFKLFGTLGLTLVFIVLQGFYMAKYFKQPPSELKSEK
jgi:intracellular septation protein